MRAYRDWLSFGCSLTRRTAELPLHFCFPLRLQSSSSQKRATPTPHSCPNFASVVSVTKQRSVNGSGSISGGNQTLHSSLCHLGHRQQLAVLLFSHGYRFSKPNVYFVYSVIYTHWIIFLLKVYSSTSSTNKMTVGHLGAAEATYNTLVTSLKWIKAN